MPIVNTEFKKVPGLRELLTGSLTIKNDWKLKTPMEKWCYVYGIGRASFGMIFIPIFNDVHNVHWLRYFYFVYIYGVPLMSLYTLNFYIQHGDVVVGLPSMCLALICLAVSDKKNFKFN